MIINAVGPPFSGVNIFKILLDNFGIRTRDNGPDLIHDRRLVDRRIPYDCNKTPKWIMDWILKYEMNGLNDYMKVDEHFFHDEWGRVCAMHALSQKYPNLDFLIMLRDPKKIIGQWFSVKGSTGPEITIETYRATVERIYEFIIEQIKYMDKKPIIMDYEKFKKGDYIKHIFKYFGIIDSLENVHKAQAIILNNKMKSCLEYQGNVENIKFSESELRKIELS